MTRKHYKIDKVVLGDETKIEGTTLYVRESAAQEGVDAQPIVQPIDNVERCHKLGMLYKQGDMLVCTSRLWEIAEYPEVKAFAKASQEKN